MFASLNLFSPHEYDGLLICITIRLFDGVKTPHLHVSIFVLFDMYILACLFALYSMCTCLFYSSFLFCLFVSSLFASALFISSFI